MVTFLYRCPNTGQRVRGVADDPAEGDERAAKYLPVNCTACGRVHLVNPETGRVLGQNNDENAT